jgi:hypothetical protein
MLARLSLYVQTTWTQLGKVFYADRQVATDDETCTGSLGASMKLEMGN